MKKLFLVLAAIAIVNIGFAQQKRTKKEFNPETKATKEVNKLADSISLSESQKESLKGEFIEFYTTVQQIKNKSDKSESDVETIKEARKKLDDNVKSILNDEKKFEKYQKMMEEKKAKRKEQIKKRRNKKDGAYNPQKKAATLATKQVNQVSSKIDLTNIQQDSLTSIFTERNIARFNFKQNTNKSDNDKADFKATLKYLEKRIENTFANTEKYECYKELRKERIEQFRKKRDKTEDSKE